MHRNDYVVEEFHNNLMKILIKGLIASLSTLPFIRDLCHTEMISRSFKSIFRTRLRSAILHFRSVGATNIDEEMRTYAAGMFSTALGAGEKVRKFYEERLQGVVAEKFGVEIGWNVFKGLRREALFLAMQLHVSIFKITGSNFLITHCNFFSVRDNV